MSNQKNWLWEEFEYDIWMLENPQKPNFQEVGNYELWKIMIDIFLFSCKYLVFKIVRKNSGH